MKLLSRLSLLILFCAIGPLATAQELSDYSVLPETMTTPPDQTPNILFILDTSGSMQQDSDDVNVGAHATTSRSYQVREVLRDLLDDNVGNFNVGLMTFGNEGPIDAITWTDTGENLEFNILNCRGYPGCPDSAELHFRDLTGKGSLVDNIGFLDATKRDELKISLATEPQRPDMGFDLRFGDVIDGNDVVVDNFAVYFPNPENNLTYNNIMISAGGTPLTGSLQTARKYLLTNDVLNDDEVEFAAGDVVRPLADPTIDAQCLPNTYVFLITDGLPTVDDTGSGVSSTSAEVTNVAAEATSLFTGGVETWLFGFGLPTGADVFMNQIAQAGSGNARNAFISDNAETLRQQIEAAIDEVLPVGGSSSGISVIANRSDGAGLVVQAGFQPELTETSTIVDPADATSTIDIEETVAWTGTVSAYFQDEFGYLREDRNGNAQLDDYSIDNAFRVEFEDLAGDGIDASVPVVQRLELTGIGTDAFAETETAVIALDDASTIWEAGDVLNSTVVTDPTALNYNATAYGSLQRPYNSVASDDQGRRHIFSWMANNPRQQANQHVGTQLDFLFTDDFVAETINAKNFLMLDPPGATDAEKKSNATDIIRFTRGEINMPGFRNRVVDGDAYILGDIVHSSSAQVDAPSSNFDLQNDDSYTEFREFYENRRRVVYVGANDGMLHAFNAGFFDSEDRRFTTFSPDDASATEHELGAELWAYVPMNLLPHLRFLTDPGYDSSVHISYVDGAVQAFDVRAWDNGDAVHVNGWGTIIVVGMRLGGGDYADLDFNANPTSTNSNYTSRSSYVILDVTDPEREPTVIAEINHPSMGFTTSQPTVVRSNCDIDQECEWHLVLGNGPNDIQTSTSSRRGRIFRYRLDDGNYGFEAGSGTDSDKIFTRIAAGNSFIGDLQAVDWDSDYDHDVVYFGSIAGTELSAGGRLQRFIVETRAVNDMYNAGRPIPYRPQARRQSGRDFVLFGTGRYFTISDAEDNEQRNAFYGLIEPRDADFEFTFPSIASNELVNVTGVQVSATDGELSRTVQGTETFAELRAYILDESSPRNRGWFSRLDTTGADAPSRKISASALTFRNFLFYTDYLPPISDGNLCTNEFGESFLNVVDITTGTANFIPDFEGPLGLEGGNIRKDTFIGDGFAGQTVFTPVPDPATGKTKLLFKTPLSTKAIGETSITLPPTRGGRTSWTELEIQ